MEKHYLIAEMSENNTLTLHNVDTNEIVTASTNKTWDKVNPVEVGIVLVEMLSGEKLAPPKPASVRNT